MADKDQPVRLPPQSVEAEQAVLGCMLIDPEAAPRVLHTLTEKSFYSIAHASIYSSMSILFEKNETIDTISVTDQLKKLGKLEDVGGAYFITGLSSDSPSATNVEYYAKIVKEKEILRSIIQSAVQMSTQAYDRRRMQRLYWIKPSRYCLTYLRMLKEAGLNPLNLSSMMCWITGGTVRKAL